MNPNELLKQGSFELGIRIADGELELFTLYFNLLKLWNAKMNLTSITDERGIVISHFLDSLSVAPFIDKRSSVLDIGSGGGFPGIPLKIVRPSLKVTLLDSVYKKVLFMKEVVRNLGLKEIKAVWGRAEDLNNNLPRGGFDYVVTRAVGSPIDVIRLSAPYISDRGFIVLMRGKDDVQDSYWTDRIEEENQNFTLVERKGITLPFGCQKRVILVFQQV